MFNKNLRSEEIAVKLFFVILIKNIKNDFVEKLIKMIAKNFMMISAKDFYKF